MRFRSTNDRSPTADLRTALLQGLAPDGGLYLPEELPPMEASTVQSLRGRPFAEVADQVAQHLLADQVDAAELSTLVRAALDFPVPLPQLSPRKSHVATLFAEDFCHGFDGPTGPHDTGLGLMESHPDFLLGPNHRPTVADLVLVEDFIGHA